jgi:transcriptional regulator with XRE-family HTH domain
MSEDVRRILGSNVRRLRKAGGLSQAELANRMGVDRADVSGLELGQRNPTIVTLWHVGQAFECGLGQFFVQPRKRSGRSTVPGRGGRAS